MVIWSGREEFGAWEMSSEGCEKKSHEVEGVRASDGIGEIGRMDSSNIVLYRNILCIKG